MNTDTKAVARWSFDIGSRDVYEEVEGPYILFTDHQRVVGELEERAVNMKSWARHDREMIEVLETELETLRAALAASRAEVEGLKKDAERYRWLREVYDPSIHDEGFEPLFSLGPDNLDAEIDALIYTAMEKGNV